ncbi:hypothetical protein GCM10027413_22150 [Conyzicola nivalis]|uniref:Uncharacterized protein n=1 Tax=Conyzicola nivalis TaxID=1477021 RepID=A0A916SC03_9MICO|nr:hypothetical protein [Conyzicola nivalis]GGA93024.1 hypothetical protein GCM10010979_04470 [Conyzicola nivalis]
MQWSKMTGRRVQFWRINDGPGAALSFKFPAKKVVTALKRAELVSGARYFQCVDGVNLLAEARLIPGKRPGLALYNRRSVNLPRQEQDGVISDLNLPRRGTLAEATFVTFFPRNIVGVLYNYQGPAASRLPEYLNAKLGVDISISPVFRSDAFDVLSRMDLSKLSISIEADQAHLLSGSSSGSGSGEATSTGLARIVDDAANYSQGGVIEITMSVGRRGLIEERHAIRERIHATAMSLARGTGLEYFNKAKAEGRDPSSGDSVSVDLIRDRLVHSVTVDEETRGSVEVLTEAAFASINSAWSESRSFLESEFDEVDSQAEPGYVGGWVSTRRQDEDLE